MADKKISALTGATTPLAGTEVLPIVQSGSTVKVAVSDLTAGRAISATQLTLTTGSLIVANGQGVDFSATPSTGTSELFADYEEGTFTVTFTMGSGTVTTNTSNNTAAYTKIGRYVFVSGNIEINAASLPSGTMSFQLPFTIASTTQNSERFAGTCLIAGFTTGNGAGMVTADSGTTAFIKDYTNANPTPDNGCEVYFGFGFIAA